jgi:hypothetical protein
MTTGERAVRIRDKVYFVTISQTSKRVWVAVGDCMGKRIKVEGSSANNAAKGWVAAARRRGHGQSDREIA